MRVLKDNTRRLLIVQEQGSPIGYVQFSNVEGGGVADWGFYARPVAAKGTGRKLGTLALDHAFNELKLHKVCGQAIDTNYASIRFHERLGFEREGVLRDQKRINDQYQTLICFGLLAREWQDHKQGN
jgi:RimJ/RimL family protein N-acetyltransferase